MTHQLFNFLISLFVLFLAIRWIYTTYKEPSEFYSTNIKGYLSGISFILISIMSLVGNFDLFEITGGMVRKSLRLKDQNQILGFVLFIALVYLILFVTYYRPDKMLNKYRISKADSYAKIKLLSNYMLFYFGFSIVILYLIVKSCE